MANEIDAESLLEQIESAKTQLQTRRADGALVLSDSRTRKTSNFYRTGYSVRLVEPLLDQFRKASAKEGA